MRSAGPTTVPLATSILLRGTHTPRGLAGTQAAAARGRAARSARPGHRCCRALLGTGKQTSDCISCEAAPWLQRPLLHSAPRDGSAGEKLPEPPEAAWLFIAQKENLQRARTERVGSGLRRREREAPASATVLLVLLGFTGCFGVFLGDSGCCWCPRGEDESSRGRRPSSRLRRGKETGCFVV